VIIAVPIKRALFGLEVHFRRFLRQHAVSSGWDPEVVAAYLRILAAT